MQGALLHQLHRHQQQGGEQLVIIAPWLVPMDHAEGEVEEFNSLFLQRPPGPQPQPLELNLRSQGFAGHEHLLPLLGASQVRPFLLALLPYGHSAGIDHQAIEQGRRSG